MMPTLASAALCAERGLHMIPVWRAVDGVCQCARGKNCISPGKHPTIDAWQNSASTDLMVLSDWFSTDRNNIGVVCGPSNIVVIDIDPRNRGDVTLAKLVSDLGPLPGTLTADTGGGGAHFVFRRPTGDLVSKLGEGVDLLRDGRQFLVEPSVHPSGRPYQWRDGHAPDEIAIADLPPRWIDRIRQRPARPAPRPISVDSDAQRIKRARAYLQKLPPAVSGANGHTATFNAVAHTMIGFDLSEADTYALIVDEYNPRCDPPWTARDLQHKITSVGKQCKRERGYLLVDRPRAAPCGPPPPAQPPDGSEPPDWQELLLTKADRSVKRAYHNTAVFVRYHPEYRGRWSHDEMTGAPWLDNAPVRPDTVHRIRAAADCRLGYTPPTADVEAAISAASLERPFHPIRQYLRSLDWDGIPRLSAMAHDYLASDEPLHAEMVRKFMIGAAARALWPGCKLDTALMLVGPQGYRKSTFFQTLGGQWHADTYIDITNKDGSMQLHSAWIYELSELENVVTGARESRLKTWMSSTHDLYRAPYARAPESKPRGVVVVGTTNRERFLTDDTGSRRFWIISVERQIPWQLLAECRDQLWAEAVCAAESQESWWLDTEHEPQREQANSAYAEEDSWSEPVAAWLESPTRVFVTTTEVLRDCLDIEIGKHGRSEQIRVARAIKACGWRKYRHAMGGLRGWLRPGYMHP